MAESLPLRDSIHVGVEHSYGTQRHMASVATRQPFIFRDFSVADHPGEEVIVTGCSEVVFQSRLCGDFYVELSGRGFCVSAVHSDKAQALRDAIARQPS